MLWDLPSDLPSELLSVMLWDLPSDLPSELLSVMLWDLPSDLPSELLPKWFGLARFGARSDKPLLTNQSSLK